MINWNYIVLLLSAFLLIFLLWKEFQRSNKLNLGLRLFATVISVTSLALMYVPFYISRPAARKPTRPLVLLTEGFHTDSLEQFIRDHNGEAAIITFDDRLISAKRYKAKPVSDIQGHSMLQNRDHPVHVFGYGLTCEEIMQLGSRPVVYHPSTIPSGITSVYWNNIVKAGEKLHIQGSFNNREKKPLKMVLSGFSATLDSAMLPAGKRYSFNLTTIPKHAGRSLYLLTILNGLDTIEHQPLPVQVEESKPLRVLLLASVPGFENKFLKNWLAQKGHQVTARTVISKNKIGTAFLNTAAAPISSVTPSVLNSFDVCITDAETLATISRGELGHIRSFVAGKSRGLIIRSDSNTAGSFYASRFPVSRLPGHETQLGFHLLDTVTSFKPLKVETPFLIRNQDGNQPLITDKQHRIFASSSLYGSGKIIFTTVTNTFNWALAGDHDDYDVFWSELLRNTAGNPPAEESWSIAPQLPKVNEAVTIQVETNQLIVPQANVSGTSVYLKNDPELLFQWKGQYWPVQSGWHPSVQTNGTIFWWYVYNRDEWKTVSAYNRMQHTLVFAARNSPVSSIENKVTRTERTAINKVLFFFLFVIACAFLWVENKKNG